MDAVAVAGQSEIPPGTARLQRVLSTAIAAARVIADSEGAQCTTSNKVKKCA